MNCDNCQNYINRGPTMVPWSDEWVNAGDDWECSEGQYPEDCEMNLADSHHAVRNGHYLLTEQELEAGDWRGDMDREGGRWQT